MYTVILYWQGETAENVVLDPECYGFLFSYAQVEDQVLRRPYAGAQKEALGHTPVSYTHLTLPTICSV